MRRAGWTVVTVLVQAAIFAAVLTAWWSHRGNTLFSNGRWIVGKDTGKFVFTTYGFMFAPLSDSRIDLSRNMAFQEILYGESDGPRRQLAGLTFRTSLSHGSYLWVELQKKGQSLVGIRLSRREGSPSGIYRYGPSGELMEEVPLRQDFPESESRWREVEVVREGGDWVLAVDGVSLGRTRFLERSDGRFGFRGSGSTRREVLVADIVMSFRDPSGSGKAWEEREDFEPGRASPRLVWAALAFALAVFSLNRWRLGLLEAFLPPGREDRFQRICAAGSTALLLMAALLPVSRSGWQAALFFPVNEALLLTSLALLCRGGEGAGRPVRAGSIAALAAAAALVGGAAFAWRGDHLGRDLPATGSGFEGVHPAAFILLPPQGNTSPKDFETSRPFTVEPGNPFFVEGRAFREQRILLDFRMPVAGTMDIAFQQQSYLTRGDPDGEELPLQRRLVRLSTRDDVATGLAGGTHSRPGSFAPVAGSLRPGEDSRVEITAGPRQVEVVLNGERTVFRGVGPLGFGLTGVMAWDGAVTVRQMRVTPTALSRLRATSLPLVGLAIPLLAAGGLWLLYLPGGRLPAAAAVSLGLSAAFPLLVFLLALLFLSPESLVFMGKERFPWMDLLLASSAVALLQPLALPGAVARWRALYGNLLFSLFLAGVALFVWDAVLPPEHPLHLRFDRRAVAPGGVPDGSPPEAGPWYGNNRLVGASTYVWKQRFGGEPLDPTKKSGSPRVFVAGGSQAWGSGAASSRETFGELLQSSLSRRGVPAEVYNGAVNGAGISQVNRYASELFLPFGADLIIADVGLNDSAGLRQIRDRQRRARYVEELLGLFREFLETCRSAGAGVVVVLEPMCSETPLRPDPELYDGLRRAALGFGVPVVDPSPVLREAEARYFVWWDTAHLAPYGHRLMASLLETAVLEELSAPRQPSR